MNKIFNTDDLVGTWTYRSFLNNPDINTDFNNLEFARAPLTLEKYAETSPVNPKLKGKLVFGEDFLEINGEVQGDTIHMEGIGATPGTKGWIYDYIGFMIPTWSHGINQVPAFVGSVMRKVAHSNGQAKAGVVASFIAVKQ